MREVDADFKDWVDALEAADQSDYKTVLKIYPYFVRRVSRKPLDVEVGEWLLPLGLNQVVVSRNMTDWVSDTVIVTHAFKHEADAIAFKLRFECE